MYTNDFIEEILSSNSAESREALISITRYLMTYHLNESNCYLYQKILHKNIKETADILFERRKPEAFFSILHPSREMILAGINTLVTYKVRELYSKIVLACLGILENSYKKSKSGFKLYPLTVSDLQHIGKYLILDEESISSMITEILQSVWHSSDNKDKDVAVIAEEILDSYYDNKKELTDVIPENLLI